MLGLLAARRLGLMASASTIEGALAKIERALPPDVRTRVNAVQETLQIDVVRGLSLPATETVMTMATAVNEGRRVSLATPRAKARRQSGSSIPTAWST